MFVTLQELGGMESWIRRKLGSVRENSDILTAQNDRVSY